MTGGAAAALGLADRGLLREGQAAGRGPVRPRNDHRSVDLRRPAPASGGHRDGDRQWHGGDRRRRAHRRSAGPAAQAAGSGAGVMRVRPMLPWRELPRHLTGVADAAGPEIAVLGGHRSSAPVFPPLHDLLQCAGSSAIPRRPRDFVRSETV
jgi:hypothetical protein